MQNRKLKLWELDRISDKAFKKQPKIPVVVILDDIRSLNNIGSFFRTADAFNVEKIMLCGITAQPPHKDIHKTALGSTETVAWEYIENIYLLAEKLKKEGYTICSIEQTQKTVLLQDLTISKGEKYALFFGNEVNGVKQEVVDLSCKIIEIPQYGTKHSLNVSVCAGIVLWEMSKALQK